MKTKRISDNIEKILNAQIANEMNSSALYRAMGNCLEYNGWVGAAKLWKKYSTEETGHAEKLQKMKDEAAMRREKLKASTSLKNLTSGEK